MLYVFGDSMSFGWGYIEKGMDLEKAKNKSWPFLLSKKLNQELKDYTLPGSSNWRMARKIQNLPITKNDIVIVQWSAPFRMEIGVNNDFEYNSSGDNEYNIIDCLETDEKFRTKTICSSLMNKTTDPICKQLMETMFFNFYNIDWYAEMSRVMISSTIYKLKQIGCEFIMFDGWTPSCSVNEYTDVKEYILRGSTLANTMRGYSGNYLPDKQHLSENEDSFCADYIFKKYNELYGCANESEEIYIPELLDKYSLPIPKKTEYKEKKESPFYI